jgi:hypothetical protein
MEIIIVRFTILKSVRQLQNHGCMKVTYEPRSREDSRPSADSLSSRGSRLPPFSGLQPLQRFI